VLEVKRLFFQRLGVVGKADADFAHERARLLEQDRARPSRLERRGSRLVVQRARGGNVLAEAEHQHTRVVDRVRSLEWNLPEFGDELRRRQRTLRAGILRERAHPRGGFAQRGMAR
jgi:hypothetical protein